MIGMLPLPVAGRGLKTRDGVMGYGRCLTAVTQVSRPLISRWPEQILGIPDLDSRSPRWLVPARMGYAMRRRLKNFLPIVLVALLVQIFAPIGACWAASLAAADPFAAATICHGDGSPANGQGDQTGHRADDGCCAVCSALQTGAPVDGPQPAVAAVERVPTPIAWRDFAAELDRAPTGSHAQARAPPLHS